MKNLSSNVQVKQKLWSKVLFKLVLFLSYSRILTVEQAVKLINSSFKVGGFKYRVNNGRWLALNLSNHKIVID